MSFEPSWESARGNEPLFERAGNAVSTEAQAVSLRKTSRFEKLGVAACTTIMFLEIDAITDTLLDGTYWASSIIEGFAAYAVFTSMIRHLGRQAPQFSEH